MVCAEKDILEDVLKSGFPTEIKAANTLISEGWMVFRNFPYIDRDSGKERSYDIRAVKYGPKHSPLKEHAYFMVKLFVECKYSSNKPWVFFRSGEPRIDFPQTVEFEPPELSSLVDSKILVGERETYSF